MCGRTRRTDVKLVGVQLSLCLLCFSGVPLRVGSADSTVEVKEDSDVILPCSLSTKENIRSKTFDWTKDPQGKDALKDVFLYDAGSHYNNGRTGQHEQFKGRVSHFPDELQHGNASIIIRKTKLADSGNYTCYFPNLQPRQTFHIELVVAPILKDRSAENLPGAAAKPSVKILHQTNHWALLQCEVKGASPKPEVEWRNSSGNILHAEEPLVTERGGSFDITINTTVTKTDTYRCVATQKEINHQIYTETSVYIHELNSGAKPGSESSSGLVVAVAVVVTFFVTILLGVVLLLALRHMKCHRKQKSNGGSTSATPREEVALKDS